MKKKNVEFKVGKDTLRGTLFIPEGKGPFPGVIFFHGSGGVGEMFFESAGKIAQHGILGFAFNYRGAGASEGKFEEQTIAMGVEDAKAAISYLLFQKEVDRGRVGFCGGSFGGYIASLLSNMPNVQSALLIAPAAYSSNVIQNTQRDADRDLNKGFEDADSYKEIKKFRGSLLVVICEFDDVLPKGMAEGYFDSATTSRKEKYLLKGANHRISIKPELRKEFEERLTNWFLETL